MKRIIHLYFCIILFCSSFTKAQTNLVKNGGFEESEILDSYSFNDLVDVYNASNATPDLIHNNSFLTPYAGSSCIGILAHTYVESKYKFEIREYVRMELTDTLMSKHNYYFSMYVRYQAIYGNYIMATSHYAFPVRVPITNCFCNKPSVYFSPNLISSYTGSTPILDDAYYTFSYTPQIIDTTTYENRFIEWFGISDRVTDWVKVEGNYTASGKEKYLLIGNFLDTLSNFYPPFYNGIDTLYSSYYHIDDVNVVCLDCDTTVGITEQSKLKNVFYNNSINTLSVSEQSKLVIYNLQGVKLLEQNTKQEENIILPLLTKGVYVWQLQSEQSIQQGKFVVNE